MSTSFQRRPKPGSKNLPGARFSPTSSNLTVSTGTPSLDAILDGGLPIGTLCLIEEDQYGSYSRIVTRCFLAEGVVHENLMCVASCEESPLDIITNLPSLVVDSKESASESRKPSDELKIAWRYENLSFNEDVSKSQNHFDLSQPVPADQLKMDNIVQWNGLEFDTESPAPGSVRNERCRNLLKRVNTELNEKKLIQSDEQQPNLMRIVVLSLGSPLWESAESSKDVTATLLVLKSLVRSANAVAMVTIPSLMSAEIADRCRHIADVAIRLKTLTKTKDANLDYHGILEVKKIFSLTSLKAASSLASATCYGFKALKKKFVIEKLHLPPAIEDKNDSPQPEFNSSCSTANSKLDF